MGIRVPTQMVRLRLQLQRAGRLSPALVNHTRRRFGGRQPLCGIGVTSLIERTWSPAAASAWIADSRPLPGPCTRTCTRLSPSPSASRAHASAATVAAKGVDFLLPLKPAFPEDAHEIVLPCMSVMVIIVLLKVALTWAIPSGSTTRFDFLAEPVFAVAMRCVWSSREKAAGRESPPLHLERCYLVIFFLPAIARRGPFLVRAFVCVRWPRTGNPRRWRMPR